MKLYNIFEELIFEETERRKKILSEGVSTSDVEDAIEHKYNVNILYQDEEGQPPSKRYIQVYNLGQTKAGNPAIRAYQIFGGSKTTPSTGAWKIFRLDRISGWFPTNMKWKKPVSSFDNSIPKYNEFGDKSMSVVRRKVDLNK